MKRKKFTVAIVGATGAVGKQILRQLEERAFPVKELVLLSSSRSSGTTIQFKEKEYIVQELNSEVFDTVDIAFFSAGGSISKEFVPEAKKRNAIVIDNSNAFRMDKKTPLVIPEVNREALSKHEGIIANPNCSTIQMLVALKPLYDRYGFNRIVVSTYQAVSGAGLKAMEELENQMESHYSGKPLDAKVLPVKGLSQHYPILYNAIPQVDVPQENGFTLEEMKMVQETKKILDDEKVGVTATCVRIPVLRCHSESIYVEMNKEFRLDDVRDILSKAPGVILQDDLENQVYPMPYDLTDHSGVFVGRLRQDLSHPCGLNMWVVSDSLLKGAAVNAIQIAESLVEDGGLS